MALEILADFARHWRKEGYGVALLNDSGLVEQPYVDEDDYPDEPIEVEGSNARLTGHSYRDWRLVLHSGSLEEQYHRERKLADEAPDYLGEARKLRELEGDEYDFLQVDTERNHALDFVEWAAALEQCGWVEGRNDVTGVVTKVNEGTYEEIWITSEPAWFDLDASYYRAK